MKWINIILPQNIFILFSFFFGITFQVVTPPFQSPDEFNHFYRAYQIADNHWAPIKLDKRVGGFVPESFMEIQDIFISQRYTIPYFIKFDEIIERDTIRLNESQKVFVDFPNTALYSPTSYIPQATAIFIGKQFNLSPLKLFYFARLATLFFWMFFVYLSIRLIPLYKWLLCFLALLPLSIFINGTLSADVVTNAIAFLNIAFTFYCAFKIENFNYKHLLFFIAVAALLALSKLIYAALIILFFCIPLPKFKSKKVYIAFSSLIVFVALFCGKLWTDYILNFYTPFSGYNPSYGQFLDLPACANVLAHKLYINQHPSYFLNVIYNTFSAYYSTYLPSYIGSLGSLEVRPPQWVFYFCYSSIFFLAIFETDTKFKFSNFQKLLFLVTICILYLLIIYSQHLSWDCIGDKKVDLLQGRYLIPIFPLMFFLFNQSKIKINPSYFILPFIILPVILFASYKALDDRYISTHKKSITTIVWNEKKQESENQVAFDKHFVVSKPNDTIFTYKNLHYQTRTYHLTDTNVLSQKQKYPTDSTIMLHSKNQYGCTYRYFNGKRGDCIYAEMLTKGNGAKIIFSADSIKSFFIGSQLPIYRNGKGWDKVRFFYMLETNYINCPVSLFLWHFKNSDTSYIKDFKIKISHFD